MIISEIIVDNLWCNSSLLKTDLDHQFISVELLLIHPLYIFPSYH